MFPPNQSSCVTTTTIASGIGAKLRTQIASYNTKYAPNNTIASAFSLDDLTAMVVEMKAYNTSNPTNKITAMRMVKAIVDETDIGGTSGTIPTLVAVPAFEDGKSVFDVLPSATAGLTPANPPTLYISTRPCPKYCG